MRSFWVSAASIVLPFLQGCERTQVVTKRFEVTAILRVGEQEVQGSAVWEAIIEDGPDIFFQYGPVNDLAGEAIEVVDPSGQPIFVLRRPAPPKELHWRRHTSVRGIYP